MKTLRTTGLLFAFGLVMSVSAQSESGTAVFGTAKPTEPVDLSPKELQKMLGSPHVRVYDCNEQFEHEINHVPGAQLIEYDHVSLDVLKAEPSDTLVFYCYSPECPAGHMAAMSAMKLGYNNVYYMLAGIIGWLDASLPTEP